jgi:NAD(P)-dependent dehydrogenase (short-subunit alcohol dehydrogenase family)
METQIEDRPMEVAPNNANAWTPANMYETPTGRLALAEEVTDACIFLASSMSSHIAAATTTIDGGRSASY